MTVRPSCDSVGMPFMSRERFEQLTTDISIPQVHRALWLVLWEGEIRLPELLSLDVRDVDLEAGTAVIEFPKLGVERQTVPVGTAGVEALRTVIGDRSEGPVFVSESGAPLSREAASRQAGRVGSGIHDFRSGGRDEQQMTA